MARGDGIYGNPTLAPITTAKRQQTLRLHTEGMGRNEIARRVGISPSSVSNIVKEVGGGFQRAAPEAAIAELRKRNAEKRALLEFGLLEDAQRLRDELFAPYTVHSFGGKDNTYNERDLSMPIAADQKNIMLAIGAAIDRSIKLSERDTVQAEQGARSLLGKIAASIGLSPDSVA